MKGRNRMRSKNILLGVILISCLWSFAAADSYQMYCKFEGIKGNTSFQGEAGWTNVLTWSWGASQSGTMHNPIITVTRSKYTGPKMESVGSLDGLGIKLTKLIDKSSPDIMSAFEKKIKIPSAKLCLLSIINGKETTLRFELKNVIVTGHAQEGNTETWTLNLGKITWH